MSGVWPSQRPRITLKFAQTLDARIATGAGQSRWISGKDSLVLAHRLRAEHDAILVGIGTILADDPELTTRHWPGPNPTRVVVDSRLRTPPGARVLTQSGGPTLIVTTGAARGSARGALEDAGGQILVGTSIGGRVDLRDMMGILRQRGIRSILVEGGAAITTSLLREHLADRVVAVIAPKIVGSGIDAIGELGIESLRDAITFSHVSIRTEGDDVIFAGNFHWLD